MNRFTLSLLSLLLFTVVGCNTPSPKPPAGSPVDKSDVYEEKSDKAQLTNDIRDRLNSLDAIFISDNASDTAEQGVGLNIPQGKEELEKLSKDLMKLQISFSRPFDSTIHPNAFEAYNLIEDLQNTLINSPGEVQEKYNALKGEIKTYLAKAAISGQQAQAQKHIGGTAQEKESQAVNEAILSYELRSLLLIGGSLTMSLISFFFALRASIRIKNQSQRHEREIKNIRKEINIEHFRKAINDEIEIQFNLYSSRAANSKFIVTDVQPFKPAQTQSKSDLTSPSTVFQPPPAFTSASPPELTGPSKQGLINSLNSGDRQLLKESAAAELNITSDSESAIAMGRSVNTELEVVPGGGSYWLIELEGKVWLFPTDRTLSGFSDIQPVKGIFKYEQQTISRAQLLEPAALEGSGNLWRVKTMGRVATP